MANRAHVPKFGDWNNQSQPFTAVFDNARTNKRADLYESLENSDIKTQAKPPPPQQPTPIIPKPVKEGKPRAPPPQTVINKVSAPPADQLYGGTGGLYGGYGGGGGSGNQRQPQAPPRPPKTQPKPNVRGGNNGRGGTAIPPFPGSVGSGDQNMSYTHIFDQVKEERRDARSYGGSAGNTPSRHINGQHESPSPSSSKLCCFPWGRKGSSVLSKKDPSFLSVSTTWRLKLRERAQGSN
ncbi:RPM1-interacting protein 4 (RIN4) family protein [Raphanus sativus]|nr:RPM1-interacting protein 4 (RIN4) family protein [Raphanus sativus]